MNIINIIYQNTYSDIQIGQAVLRTSGNELRSLMAEGVPTNESLGTSPLNQGKLTMANPKS